MGRNGKIAFQVTVSLALLAGMVYFVDLDETAEAVAHADLPLLLLAFVVVSFARILMPLKWALLLRAKGIPEPLPGVIKIYYVASFLGLYLPPTVGADVVRAFYISRRDHSLNDCVSTILVERLLGLLAMLLLAVLGIAIFVFYFTELAFDSRRLLLLLAGLTLVGTLGFYLSFTRWAGRVLLAVLDRIRPSRLLGSLAERLAGFYESYAGFRDHRGVMAVFFVLTVIESCLPVVTGWMVGLSLGVEVSLLYYFAFVPIVLILSRLPISMDGFGIHEGAYLYFLALVGVPSGIAFSVGVVAHLVFLLAIVPGGLVYALQRDTRSSVSRARDAARQAS